MNTNFCSLEDLSHVDLSVRNGRKVNLMPLWKDGEWHHWLRVDDVQYIKINMHDAAHITYLAENPARNDDLYIDFVNFAWQRASWPDVCSIIGGISHDFHLLFASVAKLEHFFNTRETIGFLILRSFVEIEIEYILTVARSIFDLLQAFIAKLWNDTFQLIDPENNKKKKQRRLTEDSFGKMVLKDKTTLLSAEEICEKYALPLTVAKSYEKFGPFFKSLRDARDLIVHGITQGTTVSVSDNGFCVDPNSKIFKGFNWRKEHYLDREYVALMPWVECIMQYTVSACSELTISLSRNLEFPPQLMPGYKVFLRDPASGAVDRLLKEKHDLEFVPL